MKRERALVAAIAVATCVLYLAGGRNGIGVSERDRLFSPVESSDTQLRLPARDIPHDGAPTLSSFFGRLSLAVALGRPSALRDLAAVATAAAVAAFGAWLLALRIPPWIVALTMMCMATSATFWGRGIAWTHDALSPALAVLVLWSTSRWLDTRSKVFAALAIGVAGAAIIDAGFDVLDAPSAPLLPGILAEFTPLGAAVIGIGLARLSDPRSPRLRFVVAWLIVALLWQFRPGPAFDPVSLPVALGGWTALAVGLTWLEGAASRRAGPVIVAAAALMIIVQPTVTRHRLWTLGRDQPSELRTRAVAEVRPAELQEAAAFVADAHRADVALRLAARRAGRALTFVPQQPELVARALNDGATVYAFPHGRTILERWAFLFEPASAGGGLALVAGRVPCAELHAGTWTDVSLLAGTGVLIVHGRSPASPPGAMRLRVAGDPPRVAAIEPRSVAFEITDDTIRLAAANRIDPIVITLSRQPIKAEATADEAGSVTLCSGPQPAASMLGRSANASLSLAMNDGGPFVSGWHPLEADPDYFRWTAAAEAAFRISLAQPGPVRVIVTATPAARPSQTPTIALIVNSCRLAAQPMPAGQADYEWVAGADCWRPGVNQLQIGVTPLISPAALIGGHDTRLLGARIGAIRFARR